MEALLSRRCFGGSCDATNKVAARRNCVSSVAVGVAVGFTQRTSTADRTDVLD